MSKTSRHTTPDNDGSADDDSVQEHVMKAKASFVLTLLGLAVCWTITGWGGGSAAPPPPPPAPTISSISPSSIAAGGPDSTLRVNGPGFVDGLDFRSRNHTARAASHFPRDPAHRLRARGNSECANHQEKQHPPKRKRIPEEHRFYLTQDKYPAHGQNA